jgi:hypothetical protein
MLSLLDAPSLERALSLPIDGHLRQLLGQRVDHLNHLDFDVRESTYFLVIDASCTIDDVTDELGWSPLINPLDGQHWGSPTFQPYHDYLRDHMTICAITMAGSRCSSLRATMRCSCF